MQLGQLRPYLVDTCLGLEVVHRNNLIHRDIKPSNILIHKGQAKLGDFGRATNDIVKGYGGPDGYVDHLAPEVYRDSVTSIGTDIWAFGMTAYRLMHGDDFFLLQPRPEEAVPRGGYAKNLSWLPHIPEHWRRVLRQAMHDDSGKRFRSARALKNALGQLPTKPDWMCSFTPSLVTWKRSEKGRDIIVRWERGALINSDCWTATSSPTSSAGVMRNLARSTSGSSREKAESELENFFRNQAEKAS